MKEKESVETLPARAHDLWAPAAQMATVGIFIILAGACLYFCRTVLLPVTVALVIGATLAPLVKVAARHGISPWVSAVVLGIGLVAAGAISISLLAQPVSEWIAKAPEIGAIVGQ